MSALQSKERQIVYYKDPTGFEPARAWLLSVKDKMTQAILFKRIRQAGLGNLGAHRSVGKGVLELKINYGPGLRIYFGTYKDELILILAGGDKSSQKKDIQKAQAYWLNWRKTCL